MEDDEIPERILTSREKTEKEAYTAFINKDIDDRLKVSFISCNFPGSETITLNNTFLYENNLWTTIDRETFKRMMNPEMKRWIDKHRGSSYWNHLPCFSFMVHARYQTERVRFKEWRDELRREIREEETEIQYTIDRILLPEYAIHAVRSFLYAM